MSNHLITAVPPVSTVDASSETRMASGAVPHLARPQDAIDRVIAGASVSPALHGFGGLHGGIGLAVAVLAMLDHGFDAVDLRSLHARYERPIRRGGTSKGFQMLSI